MLRREAEPALKEGLPTGLRVTPGTRRRTVVGKTWIGVVNRTHADAYCHPETCGTVPPALQFSTKFLVFKFLTRESGKNMLPQLNALSSSAGPN
jgi:hypothetical protein